MVWDRRYDRSRASRELAAQEHRRRVHGRGRVLFWLVVAAVAAGMMFSVGMKGVSMNALASTLPPSIVVICDGVAA